MRLTFCFAFYNRASMRLFIVALMLVSLAACKSPETKTATPPKKTVMVQTNINSRPTEQRPTVRPVDAVTGRIIAVRPQLRFVVIDFPNQKLPKLDQRLYVYRLDQKVAEIKVSGPYLGTTVAADVTAGDAREGDLVREQ